MKYYFRSRVLELISAHYTKRIIVCKTVRYDYYIDVEWLKNYFSVHALCRSISENGALHRLSVGY